MYCEAMLSLAYGLGTITLVIVAVALLKAFFIGNGKKRK